MGLFKIFHNVKHTFRKAGEGVVQTVVKPVFVASNTVTGTVYDHVVKPVTHDVVKATQFVVDEGVKIGGKGEEMAMAQADVFINTEKSLATAVGGLGGFATKVESGVGGFLENSWSYLLIGGVVLGAFVVLRR